MCSNSPECDSLPFLLFLIISPSACFPRLTVGDFYAPRLRVTTAVCDAVQRIREGGANEKLSKTATTWEYSDGRGAELYARSASAGSLVRSADVEIDPDRLLEPTESILLAHSI